ncbi:nucleotide disphospho-sugar-binding domain-containing protein [Amycolatopsis sp. NPDC059021]|uniref:nucleotide disphospho-sugar-binding domain-containing protein n=1 Tax=Amycolatopsis sp. NPDC059021 TaxID=3346704 RepID=UPI003670E34A
MRVLFATAPERERLYNLVPIAWALRAAGHEVQIAGRRDFTPVINRAGVVAIELDDAGHAAADSRSVDDLIGHARRWAPDLIVWDELMPAAPVAARVAGVPSVRVLTGADEPVVTADGFRRRMGADFGRFGLTADQGLVEGEATLDPTPRSLRPPGAGDHLAVRFVPYAGPAEVAAWLRRSPRRPRLCLASVTSEALATVFGAVAALDVEVVCTTGTAGLPAGAAVPDNVRPVESVAWSPLLSTCSAVVHGGGASQALAAVSHRLPQLVVGPETGLVTRIERAGAALTARADISSAVTRLLEDEALRAAADRLGEELSQAPAPAGLVAELTGLARSF